MPAFTKTILYPAAAFAINRATRKMQSLVVASNEYFAAVASGSSLPASMVSGAADAMRTERNALQGVVAGIISTVPTSNAALQIADIANIISSDLVNNLFVDGGRSFGLQSVGPWGNGKGAGQFPMDEAGYWGTVSMMIPTPTSTSTGFTANNTTSNSTTSLSVAFPVMQQQQILQYQLRAQWAQWAASLVDLRKNANWPVIKIAMRFVRDLRRIGMTAFTYVQIDELVKKLDGNVDADTQPFIDAWKSFTFPLAVAWGNVRPLSGSNWQHKGAGYFPSNITIAGTAQTVDWKNAPDLLSCTLGLFAYKDAILALMDSPADGTLL